MKKLLSAVSFIATLCIPTIASAQVSEWKAIVVMESVDASIDLLGYINKGSTEEGARKKAYTNCENGTGRTCRKKTSSSVPASWYLVVSFCGGQVTTGGSKFDEVAANTRAGIKLGHVDGQGCSIVWIYPRGCSDNSCRIRRN